MLIRVHRDGRVEGEYYCRLAEVEQELLKEYIPRKEKEEEAQRKKFRKWQQDKKIEPKKESPVISIEKKVRKKDPLIGKKVYTEEERQILTGKIIQSRAKGESWKKIGEKLKISPQTAQRWYKEA